MDANLIDMVRQQISGGTLQQLSQQLGSDPSRTQSAVDAAIPLLVSALARNTSQPQGAQSLFGALLKDHDGGGILGSLGSLLTNPETGKGAGILGHVFGGKRDAVEQGLGKATGLQRNQVMTLLIILAPIVLGVLGRMRQQKQLDATGVQKTLDTEKQRIDQHVQKQHGPQTKVGKGGLGGALDADNDGQIIDDIAGMVPGLGGLFGGNRR